MTDYDPNAPKRITLTGLDYVLAVLFVVGVIAVTALIRWMPEWLSISAAAAIGVALWFLLIVARKKP